MRNRINLILFSAIYILFDPTIRRPHFKIRTKSQTRGILLIDDINPYPFDYLFSPRINRFIGGGVRPGILKYVIRCTDLPN